jgi:hypothetical protein
LKRPAAGAAAVAGVAAPVAAQPTSMRTTAESSARAMDSREEGPAQSVVALAHSARRPAQSVVPPASSVGQMEAFAASVPATDSRSEPAPVVRQAVAAVALLQVSEPVLVRGVAAMELRQALVL